MVSEEGRGLVVTVGNGDSPHLRVWEAEAEKLGWRRIHVESHGVGLGGMLRTLRQAVAARKAVARAERGRTMVQAHGAGRAALVASLVSRHPTVIVHGSEVLAAHKFSAKSRTVAWALRRANEVIVTAPSSVAPVLRLAPLSRSRIRIVHPGVNWDNLTAAHVDRLGPMVILSIRRMLPLYRILELLRAHVSQSNGSSLVLLRGDVPSGEHYAEEITREAVHSAGDVRIIDRFLGSSELVDLYSSVDIAVSTAESDQLSSSVLEALGAGCVLVLSDLEAYAAIRDLTHVVLVQAGADATEIADALTRAESLVNEQGRSSTDRAVRAARARQAFEDVFGSAPTILPTD